MEMAGYAASVFRFFEMIFSPWFFQDFDLLSVFSQHADSHRQHRRTISLLIAAGQRARPREKLWNEGTRP